MLLKKNGKKSWEKKIIINYGNYSGNYVNCNLSFFIIPIRLKDQRLLTKLLTQQIVLKMKSIFDVSTREEIVSRIDFLNQQSNAKWGRMNVFQMVRHCTLCEEMMQGKIKIKRVFIGRLLGKMILKSVLKDERPFGKNSPTSPVLKTVGQTGDIEQQKKEWINRIEQYGSFTNLDFVHPFFGPMTKEQIGFFVYKHADHHLRQFGA